MTPAQIAKIMALVDALSLASYHTGTLVGVGNRPDKVEASIKRTAELRAAVEAALRDAPQAEPLSEIEINTGWKDSQTSMGILGSRGQAFEAGVRFAELKRGIAATPSAPTAVEPTAEQSSVVEPQDEDRYQLLRRGQHWSVIDGVGDVLRGDDLDAAIDSILAARASKGTK